MIFHRQNVKRDNLKVIFPQEYWGIKVGSYAQSYDYEKGDQYLELTLKEALTIFLENHYRSMGKKKMEELCKGKTAALLQYIHDKRVGLEESLNTDLIGYDNPDNCLMISTAGFAKSVPTSVKGLHEDVSVLKNIENILERYFIPDPETGRVEFENSSMMYKY